VAQTFLKLESLMPKNPSQKLYSKFNMSIHAKQVVTRSIFVSNHALSKKPNHTPISKFSHLLKKPKVPAGCSLSSLLFLFADGSFFAGEFRHFSPVFFSVRFRNSFWCFSSKIF
jgi:hypothetical protein